MNGIFWNCRGAGKKGMSTCLTDIICANNVDFIGLQETMKKTYNPSYFGNWTLKVNSNGSGFLLGVNQEVFWVVSIKTNLIL